MAKKRRNKSRNRGGNPAKATAPRAQDGAAGGSADQTAPLQRGAMSAKSAPDKKSRLRRPKRWEAVVILVVAALVAWGVWSWWSSRGVALGFEELVAEGRSGLDAMQVMPDGERTHLAPGQAFNYPSAFPTVGPHDPSPLAPGFYTRPQPNTRLVHSLEHGMIVFYYDQPGEEQLEMLRDWSGLFAGDRSGVLAVPSAGLGTEVVASAWRRQLRMDPFDAATAAAFIDRFTGRGPEGVVR